MDERESKEVEPGTMVEPKEEQITTPSEPSNDEDTEHTPSPGGLTIHVTGETNAGGRRHMEDFLAVKLSPDERFKTIPYLREQAYFGVFDGHGGREAARYARDKLWDVIQDNPKFQMPDADNICDGVSEAFETVHRQMEPLRASWKTNKMGDLSTAGTTASIIIFRQNHIFVANVGDSTTILGEVNPKAGEPGQHAVRPRVLTKDHKPDDPAETRRVERRGGKVMISRKGVPRVVWERRREDPDTGMELIDSIPFLSVSRALGDFWSYCPRSGKFAVSPIPDVNVHPLNPLVMKFVVVASDGLWNVMSPKEVVEFIWDYEHEKDDEKLHQPRDVVKAIINEALNRWKKKQLLADNISVLIAFIVADDPKAWENFTGTVPKITPSLSAALAALNGGNAAISEALNSLKEDSSSSASTASPADAAASASTTGESSADTVSPAATVASPTPSSGSTVNEESAEIRQNPTPPPTASPAPPTSPPKSPSPSTSSSPRSSSAPPSSLPNQSQEQQDQPPSIIGSVNMTRNGSTCTRDYKETLPNGVTVEFHTEIKHRHRKKRKHHSKRRDHDGSHSDGDSSYNSPGTSTSSYSLDPLGNLRRSPLKRERSKEDASTNSEPLLKKSKLDLPDSGCDCSADIKMEAEDSSPPTHIAGEDPMCCKDQTSSFENSSGVETDCSEGRNKPAENWKSDADSGSAVVDKVSSPVSSSAVSVS